MKGGRSIKANRFMHLFFVCVFVSVCMFQPSSAVQREEGDKVGEAK